MPKIDAIEHAHYNCLVSLEALHAEVSKLHRAKTTDEVKNAISKIHDEVRDFRAEVSGLVDAVLRDRDPKALFDLDRIPGA